MDDTKYIQGACLGCILVAAGSGVILWYKKPKIVCDTSDGDKEINKLKLVLLSTMLGLFAAVCIILSSEDFGSERGNFGFGGYSRSTVVREPPIILVQPPKENYSKPQEVQHEGMSHGY